MPIFDPVARLNAAARILLAALVFTACGDTGSCSNPLRVENTCDIGAPTGLAVVTSIDPAEVFAGVGTVLTIHGQALQNADFVNVCGWAAVGLIQSSAPDGTSVRVAVTWSVNNADTGRPQLGLFCVNIFTPQGNASWNVTLLPPP